MNPGARILVLQSSPLASLRGRSGTVVERRRDGISVVMDGDETIHLDEELVTLPPELDWKRGSGPTDCGDPTTAEWHAKLQALSEGR